MTEDPREFSTHTRTAWAQLEKFAESGDLDGMRAAGRIVSITIDYALSANRVLQPVVHYLAVPDADLNPKAYARACEESDKAAKKKLSEIDSLLQAARKLKLHERRGGTRHRNLSLTHGGFANEVKNLARQLQRVPFRAEIADETGETLKAIGVKLKAIGAAWIPTKGRGKDKNPRKKWT